MCMAPVGEGAIRVTTGLSDIEVREPEAAAAAKAEAAPLSTPPSARPSLAAGGARIRARIEPAGGGLGPGAPGGLRLRRGRLFRPAARAGGLGGIRRRGGGRRRPAGRQPLEPGA